MSRSQRVLLLVAGIAFAAYFAFRLHEVSSTIDLRDYRTYYSAAKAFVAGDDPYDLSVLSAYAGTDHRYAFVYPKHSLVFFIPLTLFEYQTSAIIFIFLKAIALLALAFLWAKYFLPDIFSALLLSLFLVTAYNGTLLRDVAVGNVSVFEQLLLWLAIVCYLKGNITAYYPLVVASALFKPTTGAFLLLPLVLYRGKRVFLPSAIGIVFLALYYVPWYLGQDELFDSRISTMLWEKSLYNPSVFAVLRESLEWFGLTWHESVRLTPILTAIYAGMLILATVVILKKENRWKNPSFLVLAGIFLYVLLLPRFKDYSYILMIVPSVIVVRDMLSTTLAKSIAVVLVCVYMFAHQPYYTAAVLFVVFLIRVRTLPLAYTILRESPRVPSTATSNN